MDLFEDSLSCDEQRAYGNQLTELAERFRQRVWRTPYFTAAHQSLWRATTALVAIITEMGHQIEVLEARVVTHFGQHPDSDIYLSQPGLGNILRLRRSHRLAHPQTRSTK